MSHFTVLVIGKDVEQILAPFQENNMGDCPATYLEFQEVESEYLEQYQKETRTRVVMPDGSFVGPHDEQFEIPGTNFMSSERYRVPAELEQREVPFTQLYATFEEFMSDYCGYEQRDPEKGVYGGWANPNAKWDWYELGGRWTGFFKLKRGSEGTAGRPGLLTQSARTGYVDQAKKGDIDFEGMRKVAAKKAEATFDRYAAIVAEHGEPPALDQEDESKREAYFDHPTVKALFSEHIAHYDSTIASQFGMGREAFIERAKAQATGTFAVVHEGKWYQRGEMGWFGCVSDEKNPADWFVECKALLDGLPDDAVLSLVDCHI